MDTLTRCLPVTSGSRLKIDPGYANFAQVAATLAPDIDPLDAWNGSSDASRNAWREGACAAFLCWDSPADGDDVVMELIADLDACEGAMRAGVLDMPPATRLAVHGALARLTLALLSIVG